MEPQIKKECMVEEQQEAVQRKVTLHIKVTVDKEENKHILVTLQAIR